MTIGESWNLEGSITEGQAKEDSQAPTERYRRTICSLMPEQFPQHVKYTAVSAEKNCKK